MAVSVYTVTGLALLVICAVQVDTFSVMAPMDMYHVVADQPTMRTKRFEHSHMPFSFLQRPASTSTAKPIPTKTTPAADRWGPIGRHFRRIAEAETYPVMFERF